MISGVSAFLTWVVEYMPSFLLSHPVIDIIAIAVAIWVLALVFRLLSLHRS